MRGHLLIFIAGYRPRYDHSFWLFNDGKQSAIVSDRLHTTPILDYADPDSRSIGWTVGDNSRERFCKWLSDLPKRTFYDFDEAVNYIHALRRKRKGRGEAYSLIYLTNDDEGTQQSTRITCEADIDAFEERLAREAAQRQQQAADEAARLADAFPCVDILLTHYKRAQAYQLARLLKDLQTDGPKVVKDRMTPATYYRQVKQLMAAGIIL